MAEVPLTRGAVAAIAASKMWEVAPAAQRAVLQVVDVSWFLEPVLELDGSSRRRKEVHTMVLSDGVHTLGEFSFSTPLDHYLRDGRIRKGTVLRLLSFCCNVCGFDNAANGVCADWEPGALSARGLKRKDLAKSPPDGNCSTKTKYQWPTPEWYRLSKTVDGRLTSGAPDCAKGSMHAIAE